MITTMMTSQHELDHLNGVMFIDRMQPNARLSHDAHDARSKEELRAAAAARGVGDKLA